MSNELSRALDQVARDKGVDRAILIEALQEAMVAAARKVLHKTGENIEAQYNEELGEVEIFEFKDVSEVVEDPNLQITLEDALNVDPGAQIGDSLGFKIDTTEFGRIAYQNAKQIIVQRMRQADRDLILAEFQSKVGTIITGVVRRVVNGNVILELGRAEAILPRREQIPGESYRSGDRVRALLQEISVTGRGPELVMSRAAPDFLRRLFEFEVPETYDGVVTIKAIAREAGSRSKVAVESRDPDVDPVGAAVGIRGVRVQNIVQELRGEKVDIIAWSDDPARLIENALSPAEITQVIIDEERRLMQVVVPDDQLSLAIGRRGQNVKLAVELTGWNIDITSEREAIETSRKAKLALGKIPGITDTAIELLFHAGFTTIREVAAMSDADNVAESTGLRRDRLTLYVEGAKDLVEKGLADVVVEEPAVEETPPAVAAEAAAEMQDQGA